MTDQTIVALYDDQAAASRVLQELHSAGFDRGDFWISGSSSGGAIGGRLSSLASDFSSGSGRVSSLTRLGVPQSDAEIYAEGVRRGGALLVGVVDDDESTRALDIIERHGPTDIDERGRFFRESGWSGYDHSAIDYTSEQTLAERSRYSSYGTGLGAAASGLRDTNRAGTEEHIPIVEENLEVGKRAVERGGVRVHTRLVETPVEQSVTLRDETVSVERRAVDRPIGDIPADALRERSIEVTETDEVPVVAKSAHIREEVVIRKDVQERAETVRDTVRHTEVDIDKTDGGITRDDINRRDRT
ncbi:MAG TPA: YsnF/AvaK domain-containing protein [Azospirillaceae bacterium]|nr:YsnF/AvaK domain-containing protein [Azospirillaceae bacterium]